MTAWETLPHTTPTRRPLPLRKSTIPRGTPRPVTRALAPPSATALALASKSSSRARMLTAKGCRVSLLISAHSARICSTDSDAAPTHPMPPASLTSAASLAPATPAIPADITGTRVPRMRHSGRWENPPTAAAGMAGEAALPAGQPSTTTASWENVPPFAWTRALLAPSHCLSAAHLPRSWS